jgi:glutamate synthase (NADPH/NADH) large chain
MKEQRLTEDHLTLRLKGSAGQSLGAFGARGLKLIVDGDANDYVGKGLSGATIVVRPPAGQDRGGQSIIGNTCLYGATSGALFAAGRAGGRFAVRNSGATAVVEGCSANGCEYMTGGAVVVLGAIGVNFGAGMTGGEAFVFDPEARFTDFANFDTIVASSLGGDAERRLKVLIERHCGETQSQIGERILADWRNAYAAFRHVRAKEMIRKLELEAAQEAPHKSKPVAPKALAPA